MELSIAANGNQGLPLSDPRRGKEKQEPRKGGKPLAKTEGKETMTATVRPVKFPVAAKKREVEKPVVAKEKPKERPSLKERQERKYPFLDTDLSAMLDELLKSKLLTLPEMKRPEEAGRIDHPKYCKYHRLISHPIEQCFVLKDRIMELADNGYLEFDGGEATANSTSIMHEIQTLPALQEEARDDLRDEEEPVRRHCPKPPHGVWIESGNCEKAYWVIFTPPKWVSNDLPVAASGWGDEFDEDAYQPFQEEKAETSTVMPFYSIKFGSLDPVDVQGAYPCPFEVCSEKQRKSARPRAEDCMLPITGGIDGTKPRKSDADDEGWTLVTRRRKSNSTKPKSPQMRPKKHRKRSKVAKKKQAQKKAQKKKPTTVLPEDLLEQESRIPVTLWEFLPWKLQVETCFSSCVVTCYETQDEPEPSEGQDDEESKTEDSKDMQQRPQADMVCMSNLTFTDEDLLLGSELHNRPLFVTGYTWEQRVKRILLDGGSAVNILPARTLKKLGISLEDLLPSHLMIQGFNQGGQRAIGKIRLELLIEDMTSSALFHVIEAKTSYNMLLGRPWIHDNKVVPSTLHQCFKYNKDGVERKIMADENPFTEAEAYFADAKFFKSDNSKGEEEGMEPSVDIVETRQQKHISALLSKKQEEPLKGKQIEQEHKSGCSKLAPAQVKENVPVLRYIPMSRRQEGQSPFAGHDSTKADAGRDLTIPVQKLTPS